MTDEYTHKMNCPLCKGAIVFTEDEINRAGKCPICAGIINFKGPPIAPRNEFIFGKIIPYCAWGLILFVLAFMPLLLSVICWIGIGALVLIGIPVAIFAPKAREWIGLLFVCWSMVSLANIICGSFTTVSLLWGTGAAVVGIIFGIIGVIPEAVIACLIKSQWEILAGLLLNLFLTVAAFCLPLILLKKESVKINPSS